MTITLNGPGINPARVFTIEFRVVEKVKGRPSTKDDNGDLKDWILVTLSNCALTNRYLTKEPSPKATLKAELTQKQLVLLVVGALSLDDPTLIVTGDTSVWLLLKTHLTTPNPPFAILTP